MELEIKSFKVGERVVGTVIGVEKDTIFMDIGASCDAKIDKQHYSYDTINDFRTVVKNGDEIKTMITYVSDEQILLSRLPFEKEEKFNKIKEKMATEEVFPLLFEKFNRGGLEHRDIFTYFMPTSQIGIKGAEPKDYVNQAFEVMITDVNEERQQFIVSARKVNDNKYQAKKDAASAEVSVDNVLSVKVTNVVEAGVEVRYADIIRGFVPRNQLSHLRFDKVANLHKIGETLDVKVIEVRKDGQFVASIKALQPTPWETFTTTHKVDDVVEGTIKKITEIGAFVEIIPGVEGLLHKSEVSYDEFANYRDLLKENEKIQVKIINISDKDRRLSLSIKKLEKDPWDSLWQDYHEGDVVKVTVKRIERNHLWVTLIQYVDAILYRREALVNDNQELNDVYSEDQELEVKITELNPRRRRVIVSLAAIVRDEEQKQLAEYREKAQSEIVEDASAFKGKFNNLFGATSEETKVKVEEVKAKAKDAVENVKDLVKENVEKAQDKIEEISEEAKPKVAEVSEKIADGLENAGEKIADLASKAADKIKDAISDDETKDEEPEA